MTTRAYIVCNASKSAQTLISMSLNLDCTISAPHSPTVDADLLADSDGTATSSGPDGEDVTEYWGDPTDDCASWRVHMHH
jgi:hypothetical protein